MTPKPAREPDDFRQLVRGDIDSEEYVRRLRERVQALADGRRERMRTGRPVLNLRPDELESSARTASRLEQSGYDEMGQ